MTSAAPPEPGLRALFSLSSSLSSAKTAAGNIDLMTVNGQASTQRPGYRLHRRFSGDQQRDQRPGAGTSSAPQKYLFFVSDGVADESNTGCLKPTTGGRCQAPINPALCTTIKNRGIKIAVLYTTYLALPTNAWYNSWIAPFNLGPMVRLRTAKSRRTCKAARPPDFISRSARPRAFRRR